jgi:hypothetical protein
MITRTLKELPISLPSGATSNLADWQNHIEKIGDEIPDFNDVAPKYLADPTPAELQHRILVLAAKFERLVKLFIGE